MNRVGSRRLAPVVEAVRGAVGGRHIPVAAGGLLLVVVGSLSPWATFFFGYPGKVSLAGFPGGVRLYTLLLAAVAVLAAVDVPGRRRAGLAGSNGILFVAVFNLLAIAFAESFPLDLLEGQRDGGGLGAVAFGAWITAVGGALLLAAFASLPDDRHPPLSRRPLPAPVELVLIAVSLGVLLALVVIGLELDDPTRFISFVAFASFGAAALHRVGAFAVLQQMTERHRAVAIGAAGIAAAAFPFTQQGNSYWLRVFASVGVFATAAIGLNVVIGLAGLLDLGYIAFFGVGAYTGALLGSAVRTTVNVEVPFLLAVLAGATLAAVFGVIVGAPTLRLRGDYLAIVTLGFGEIFRIAVNNMDWLTRGPNGIAGVSNVELFGFNFGETHKVLGVNLPGFANYYFLELVLLAGAILAFTRLNTSRIGRAWVAIREDEVAASAMGIDTFRLKLLAFAIGAFLAGSAGTVSAHVAASATPESFTFLESILLVAAVVLGGMGTVQGALLGSAALYVIPEKLRSFQDKRLALFGLALILMMRFRPEGIVASRRRQQELHSEDGGGDAMTAAPGGRVAVGTAGGHV